MKKIREQKKLSQKEVAEKIGYSPQVYNRWELGKNDPNIEALVKLANFFDVTIDYLLENSTTPNLTSIQKDFEALEPELQELFLRALEVIKKRMKK